MATRKQRRMQKKREESQAREEVKRADAGQPSISELRRLAKAEKAARKAQKEEEQRLLKEKLEKARAEAETVRKQLSEQEESLRDKGQVLEAGLEDEAEETGGKGLFAWLWAGMARTRDSLAGGLGRLLLGSKTIDKDLYHQLEELLITSDVGVETTDRLLEAIRARVRRDQLTDPQALREVLQQEVMRVMGREPPPLKLGAKPPVVVLVVGVNGSGKTTTIGKLASAFQAEGRKVLLAAGDTFRAAAGEQLEMWAERSGAAIERSEKPGDPSGVIHRAVRRAMDEGYDLVLCDTAGRLHTQQNLMEELKKIKRVITKLVPEAPHETWLVLDANTGHNAILQTRDFHKEIGVTGLIVTKLDGTARGGVIIGIVNEFGLPVRYVGVGEGAEDLRPFAAQPFAKFIFE